jgi:hypothetical protein
VNKKLKPPPREQAPQLHRNRPWLRVRRRQRRRRPLKEDSSGGCDPILYEEIHLPACGPGTVRCLRTKRDHGNQSALGKNGEKGNQHHDCKSFSGCFSQGGKNGDQYQHQHFANSISRESANLRSLSPHLFGERLLVYMDNEYAGEKRFISEKPAID